MSQWPKKGGRSQQSSAAFPQPHVALLTQISRKVPLINDRAARDRQRGRQWGSFILRKSGMRPCLWPGPRRRTSAGLAPRRRTKKKPKRTAWKAPAHRPHGYRVIDTLAKRPVELF
ncbi:hypothetical protein KM043_004414 [Ampulex compressa]|nr:hypothetical protein KM043_004414 [Ampulex compressa]